MLKSLWLVMIGIILVMSGCSSGTKTDLKGSIQPAASGTVIPITSGTPEPMATKSGEKVTLTYAAWGDDVSLKAIIAKFKESHPNIDVKLEVTPAKQYWPKLETAAIGDVMPDVFWMNGINIAKYASANKLLPITNQISGDNIDMGNYPQGLVDLYKYDGQEYALPKDFDTIALWYNKALFDAAGVKYPDENWDWNALLDAAKKLTNPSKGIWGFAADLSYGQEGYYNTIIQNGGYVISDDRKTSGYDKPKTIGGIKFWTDAMNVTKVMPTYAKLTETGAGALFTSGKLAMFFGGSWNAGGFGTNEYTKDKVDVTLLPKGVQRGGVIHGLGNVIAAKSKHPHEAWEFLKFLGSKEAQTIEGSSGSVIPAYKGTQDLWIKAFPQFHLQAYIDMLQYSKPYPVSEETAKWNAVEQEALNKAFAGTITPEEAGKQIAEKMNALLALDK